MTRVESPSSLKGRSKLKNKVPEQGTKLRELWDLLHVYRGEVFVDNLQVRYPKGFLNQLIDFYGLDIRNLGRVGGGPNSGKGSIGSRWILAGEWFGAKYVDYIAERLEKKGALR